MREIELIQDKYSPLVAVIIDDDDDDESDLFDFIENERNALRSIFVN